VQVILIRHAEAVDESLALRDPHRHLTQVGRRQAHDLGDRLRWHDCTPTHVWSSPLVRAVQTAEVVLGRYEPEIIARISVEIAMSLAPGSEHGERVLVTALGKLPASSTIYLVGHEPSISAIGAVLARNPSFAALTKGQAVRIDDGRVRWRFAHDAEAPVLETK